jgi:beta-phosphoglucomutase-like phosphatase (HAD superfamily)
VKPTTLRALIFDVDGTLADTEETHRRAFNESFGHSGLDWNWSKPVYTALLRTTGGKERIAAYIDSLQLEPAARALLAGKIADIHRAKTAIYARMISDGQAPLRDGIARLLDEAEAAGVRLSIATTTTFENIRALVETNLGAGTIDRFAVIGAGDAVPRKKPASDVYEYVLRALGESADACAAIEDSANGLAAAKGAGLFTIVTPSYWTEGEDFAAADWLLPSLGTLERPLTGYAAMLVGNDVVGIREIDDKLTSAHRGAQSGRVHTGDGGRR